MVLVSLIALLGVQAFPKAEADALCRKFMSENEVVGMSVAVYADNKMAYAAGFGDADLGKRKADQNTIYRLGSVSKPVTAVIAMKHVEQSKLRLDADIRTYVPEFPSKPWPVSARQILTHSSGIRHYLLGSESGITKSYSSSEAINLFGQSALLFQPGTKRSYSTHAFTVLARAIEVVGNASFDRQVASLAKQAAAPTLACEDLTKVPAGRSRLYGFNAQGKPTELLPPENNSWKNAGGGMESSAVDLAKFGSSLLNGQLLKPSSLSEMWKSHDTLTDRSTGLGWFLVGEDEAEHGGAQQGCRAHLRIFRKANIVVAVLTNTSSQKNAPSNLTRDLGRLVTARRTR